MKAHSDLQALSDEVADLRGKLDRLCTDYNSRTADLIVVTRDRDELLAALKAEHNSCWWYGRRRTCRGCALVRRIENSQ